MRRLVLILLALAATPATAQPKLAGTFQIGACEDRPRWSSFALLIDTDNFEGAAACSQRTGLRWVLYLTADAYQPIGPHVTAVRARAEASGLAPHVIALTDHEEWYERVLAVPPAWPIGALDPTVPADQWVIAATAHRVASQRTAEIKRLWPGLPVVWITSLVNDDRRYGAFRWRPLPAGIDVIALEGYVPAWGTWDTTAGLYLAHAIRTRPEPIVLITQGFKWTGDPQWAVGPTEDAMRGTEAALAHERVRASWLFTWGGYGSELTGLKQMPYWQSRYEQAIGVR